MACQILTELKENLKYPKLIKRTKPSGNTYYYYNYVDKENKKRTEVPLGSNRQKAISRYKELHALNDNKQFIAVPIGYENYLIRTLKKNAKSRLIPVEITADDIKTLLEKCNGKCSITGIQFNMHKQAYKMRPWIPSIDRIDSNKPYTVDNIRIVCAYVNLAINQYGLDALIYVAIKLLKNRSKFAE